MTLATEGARLLAEKRRTHGGPTGLTTENEAGAYAAEQFAMWLCLNGERLVDALVEAERDAERLDWLNQHKNAIFAPCNMHISRKSSRVELTWWAVGSSSQQVRADNIRAAIDAAKGKP